METFLFAFAFFAVAILGMAVGVILSNRKLKGSCGGLNKVMGDDCMFCERKEECKEERKSSSDEEGPLHFSSGQRPKLRLIK